MYEKIMTILALKLLGVLAVVVVIGIGIQLQRLYWYIRGITCEGCHGSGRQQYLTDPEPDSKTGKPYWAWWTCDDCKGTGKEFVDE